MGDVSRRGFLSILAVSPLAAPAALKAAAEMATAEPSYTFCTNAVTWAAPLSGINTAAPMVWDAKATALYVHVKDTWRKIVVS